MELCQKPIQSPERLHAWNIFLVVFQREDELLYCISGRQFSHESALTRCYIDDFPQSLIKNPLNDLVSVADKNDWSIC